MAIRLILFLLIHRLYAVGGRDGSACLRTVERFNPHTQHWCFIAPMLHRRGGVGVGAIGGRLYAVGGHNAPPNQPHALRTASVEMYEPRTDMWTEVCALSSPRDSIAVAPLGYKLYALGGHDGQAYTDRVEVYDPEENKWTEVSYLLKNIYIPTIVDPDPIKSYLNLLVFDICRDY